MSKSKHKKMNKAVIGLGFGDEGKGLVTDYLCSLNPDSLVVRYSGGQQAGHTVVIGDKRHVHSSFGSGTLRGNRSYIDEFCTIDPIAIMNEYHSLKNQGVSPILYINNRCPVTTPFEMYYNRNFDKDNGTCGVGVGATYRREQCFYSLLAGDISNKTVLGIKLKLLSNWYGFNVDVKRFLIACDFVFNNFVFVDNLPNFSNYIFESSQGLLLDQNIGFFPHVTRASVGSVNIEKHNPHYYFVTRAYQTRHGNGPMTNNDIKLKNNKNETNKLNPFQGEFRTSILDLDLLLYGLSREIKTKNKTLVITCLDQITEYSFIWNGIKCNFGHESSFIEKIALILGFDNILISKGETSLNISEYETLC